MAVMDKVTDVLHEFIGESSHICSVDFRDWICTDGGQVAICPFLEKDALLFSCGSAIPYSRPVFLSCCTSVLTRLPLDYTVNTLNPLGQVV